MDEITCRAGKDKTRRVWSWLCSSAGYGGDGRMKQLDKVLLETVRITVRDTTYGPAEVPVVFRSPDIECGPVMIRYGYQELSREELERGTWTGERTLELNLPGREASLTFWPGKVYLP